MSGAFSISYLYEAIFEDYHPMSENIISIDASLFFISVMVTAVVMETVAETAEDTVTVEDTVTAVVTAIEEAMEIESVVAVIDTEIDTEEVIEEVVDTETETEQDMEVVQVDHMVQQHQVEHRLVEIKGMRFEWFDCILNGTFIIIDHVLRTSLPSLLLLLHLQHLLVHGQHVLKVFWKKARASYFILTLDL